MAQGHEAELKVEFRTQRRMLRRGAKKMLWTAQHNATITKKFPSAFGNVGSQLIGSRDAS